MENLNLKKVTTTIMQLEKLGVDCTKLFPLTDKDAKINFSEILEVYGLESAIDIFSKLPDYDAEKRFIAITFALACLHKFTMKYPNDKRPHDALEAAALKCIGIPDEKNVKGQAAAQCSLDIQNTKGDIDEDAHSAAMCAAVCVLFDSKMALTHAFDLAMLSIGEPINKGTLYLSFMNSLNTMYVRSL